MIEGVLSLSVDNPGRTIPGWLRHDVFGDNAVFNPINTKDFDGGFYLHSGLPHRSRDIFFEDFSNDILVLFYGSVYNREELNRYFDRQDMPDPEGIARMFLDENEAFVNKLNGDFAAFIYRPERKKAWLFRDHVGIRPLAWTVVDRRLIFSTDAIGLCKVISGGSVTGTDYLLGWFKYIDYRKCPDKEVHKLPQGHFLRVGGESTELVKYWSPEKVSTDRQMTHDRMISDLGFLLNDAVKMRCSGRYNAGAHVSSGIDSGVVASLARTYYRDQDNFYGFSWSPATSEDNNIRPDERELVMSICEASGISPIFSGINPERFIGSVKSFYQNQGYFEEHLTLEQAGKLNVNLLFSGWGGDEFISTGDRAIEIDLIRELRLTSFFRWNPLFPVRKFIRYQIDFTLNPVLGILGKEIRRSFRNDARHIIRPLKKSDPEAIKNYYFHTSRRQLHLRYLRFYHLQERCESWAVNGFRHGVEYRYPLLDKRIIEYMLKVPSELLAAINQFRPVIRELAKGIIPEDVRLNLSKKDRVHSSCLKSLFRFAGETFMNEVSAWKSEPGMNFVDFKLLDEDIKRYRNDPESSDGKILFRSLVYLKAIQSFCREYSQKNA